MARYYLIAAFCLVLTSFSWADVSEMAEEVKESISGAIEEINKSYEQCEALYEKIRNSECANSIFGFIGRMYLKLGVSFTERQVRFADKNEDDDAVFRLTSGLKPRPIFAVSIQDSYFSESDWGYAFGFSYFDDYAFEQQIKRGSSSQDRTDVDLGTYSSMNVISFTPTGFYSWGRHDSTPNRYLKVGIGLNLMYSSVRGTAYLTEDESDEDCYASGSQIVSGASLDLEQLKQNCDFTRFRESSYGSGIKLFLAGDWNQWESELSVSIYNHRSAGDYRFVTQEMQLAFSRKFAF